MGRSFGWRRRDGFEGGDDAGGPGAEAVVDVGGEFFGGLVAAAEHFEFGVDVVDVVEGDGFGGLGEDGRAEFEGAVMGGDEVEEVSRRVQVAASGRSMRSRQSLLTSSRPRGMWPSISPWRL